MAKRSLQSMLDELDAPTTAPASAQSSRASLSSMLDSLDPVASSQPASPVAVATTQPAPTFMQRVLGRMREPGTPTDSAMLEQMGVGSAPSIEDLANMTDSQGNRYGERDSNYNPDPPAITPEVAAAGRRENVIQNMPFDQRERMITRVPYSPTGVFPPKPGEPGREADVAGQAALEFVSPIAQMVAGVPVQLGSAISGALGGPTTDIADTPIASVLPPPQTNTEAAIRGGASLAGEAASYVVPSLPGATAKIGGGLMGRLLGKSALAAPAAMAVGVTGFTAPEAAAHALRGVDAAGQPVAAGESALHALQAGPHFVAAMAQAPVQIAKELTDMLQRDVVTPEEVTHLFETAKPLAAVMLAHQLGKQRLQKGPPEATAGENRQIEALVNDIRDRDLERVPLRQGAVPRDVLDTREPPINPTIPVGRGEFPTPPPFNRNLGDDPRAPRRVGDLPAQPTPPPQVIYPFAEERLPAYTPTDTIPLEPAPGVPVGVPPERAPTFARVTIGDTTKLVRIQPEDAPAAPPEPALEMTDIEPAPVAGKRRSRLKPGQTAPAPINLTPEQIKAGVDAGVIQQAGGTGGPDAAAEAVPPAPALPGKAIGDKIRADQAQRETFSKEPWRMTLGDYVEFGSRAYGKGSEARPSRLRDLKKIHRAGVEQALKDGKPVPSDVMADYPEWISTPEGGPAATAATPPAAPALPASPLETGGLTPRVASGPMSNITRGPINENGGGNSNENRPMVDRTNDAEKTGVLGTPAPKVVDETRTPARDAESDLVDDVGYERPAPPKHWPDIDKALFDSAHSVSEAGLRWDALRKSGATDAQIKDQLSYEFGISGGGSGSGYAGYSHRGGQNPAVWVGHAGRGKPDLSGNALIAAARRVLDIPQPKSSGPVAPESQAPGVAPKPKLGAALGAKIRGKKLPPIAELAHEAATSPLNDRPQPTEAQREAGNFKHGHIKFDGLDISIENPTGSERRGVGADGKPWSVPMTANYGYLKRTTSADGENVDVYLPDEPKAGSPVHVVNQVNLKTGKFDEHKVVLGVESRAEAEKIYDAHFSDGSGPKRRAGGIETMPLQVFKERLESGQFEKAPSGRANATAVTQEQPHGSNQGQSSGQDSQRQGEAEGQAQGNQGLLTTPPAESKPAALPATAAQPESLPEPVKPFDATDENAPAPKFDESRVKDEIDPENIDDFRLTAGPDIPRALKAVRRGTRAAFDWAARKPGLELAFQPGRRLLSLAERSLAAKDTSKKISKASRDIIRQIKNEWEEGRAIGSRHLDRLESTVKGLNKSERENLIMTFGGREEAKSPKVTAAVDVLRRLDEETNAIAIASGMLNADGDPWRPLRKNWIPQTWNKDAIKQIEHEKGPLYEKALDLVEEKLRERDLRVSLTGDVGAKSDALTGVGSIRAQAARWIKRNRNRLGDEVLPEPGSQGTKDIVKPGKSGVQLHKLIDWPREFLAEDLVGSFARHKEDLLWKAAQARVFGPRHENLRAASNQAIADVERVARERGDNVKDRSREARRLIQTWYQRTVGLSPPVAYEGLARGITMASSVLHLSAGSAFTVANAIMGARSTMNRFGILRGAAAITKAVPALLFKGDAYREAKSSGVLDYQGIAYELRESHLPEFAKEVLSGFSQRVEASNRTGAMLAGEAYANGFIARMHRKALNADGSIKPKLIVHNEEYRQLKEVFEQHEIFSMIRRGEMTPEQAGRMRRGAAEVSQYLSRPQDLPLWMTHPWGRVFGQFWGMAYKEMQNGIGWSLKEAGHGNLIPLARFMLLAVPAGFAQDRVRQLLYGARPNDDDKSKLVKLMEYVANTSGLLDRGFDVIESGNKWLDVAQRRVMPVFMSDAEQIMTGVQRTIAELTKGDEGQPVKGLRKLLRTASAYKTIDNMLVKMGKAEPTWWTRKAPYSPELAAFSREKKRLDDKWGARKKWLETKKAGGKVGSEPPRLTADEADFLKWARSQSHQMGEAYSDAKTPEQKKNVDDNVRRWVKEKLPARLPKAKKAS